MRDDEDGQRAPSDSELLALTGRKLHPGPVSSRGDTRGRLRGRSAQPEFPVLLPALCYPALPPPYSPAANSRMLSGLFKNISLENIQGQGERESAPWEPTHSPRLMAKPLSTAMFLQLGMPGKGQNTLSGNQTRTLASSQTGWGQRFHRTTSGVGSRDEEARAWARCSHAAG